MRILADTHVLLWWLADDGRLPEVIHEAIADARNEIFFSAVSVAETAIKASLGKLEAPEDMATVLTQEGFLALAFTHDHAERLRHLPWHHRDPFDRMLVAQAMAERLTLASVDTRLREYDVALVGP